MLLNPLNPVNHNSNFKTHNKSQKQIAFTAQKYPHGEYSDWFIKESKKQIKLILEDWIAFLEKKMNLFELELTANSSVDESLRSRLIAIRKSDYQRLQNDLIKQDAYSTPEPPVIQRVFDEPPGKYSSEKDYNAQNGIAEETSTSSSNSDYNLSNIDVW